MSATISQPMLLTLLEYWQEKRGDRALPSRRDIDPVEMGADLLPHLMMVDLLDRGTRARFRLVGTALVKRLGFDPTGRYLEGVGRGGWFELLGGLFRLVYAERAPVLSESDFEWGSARHLKAQNLLLPLTQDGPDPAIALCGLVFTSRESFPPSLQALGEGAAHVEGRRQVMKTLPALGPRRKAGREVA